MSMYEMNKQVEKALRQQLDEQIAKSFQIAKIDEVIGQSIETLIDQIIRSNYSHVLKEMIEASLKTKIINNRELITNLITESVNDSLQTLIDNLYSGSEDY